MDDVVLKEIDLPDFGVPRLCPELPAALYAARLDRLRARIAAEGLDAVAIYGDREHFANIAWVSGVDPRFEEALLIVVPGRTPVYVAGPETKGMAEAAPVELEVAGYPPFGLLGQDRAGTPRLSELLAGAGLAPGQRIGVAGWKFFTGTEFADPERALEVPSYLADALRALAGPSGEVVNATALLMAAADGLRAENEPDQIARFEFAAAHASEGLRRVLFGLRPGMTEFEAAALMGLNGFPLSCHPMLSAGDRAFLGLGSPGSREIGQGDPITMAVGLWGGLSCRAGWVAASADDLPEAARDYVARLAAPYWATAAEWLETIGLGVTGGTLDALVRRRLGDPFFGIALNPGHLLGLDEWLDSPVAPGSAVAFRSGHAVQLDIIPATGSAHFTANMEDGVVLLDAAGRAELAERHPEVWGRIEARRGFMGDVLGLRLRPEVLPMSNLAGVFAPFWLSPGMALARG